MDVLAPLWFGARVALLLAGLLGPGALVMGALRLPRTPASCFAGSALALYLTVLALTLSATPIGLGSLAAGLGTIALLAFLAARVRPRPPGALATAPENESWCAPFTRMGAWTPLYLAFWAILLFRAVHEPLAGPDVEFRWSFLAEQMLTRGSLDFYPPRSAADFLTYYWAESIPPGVSALHAWAYACAGKIGAAWTVPAVGLQFLALHDLAWRTMRRLVDERAARFACLALAACPLLTWSVLLAQETGLTALALLGIAGALVHWHPAREARWAALAGVFAALGATTREYGLVFPALAGGGLLVLRADRRSWGAFLAVAAPVSAIWPIRCAVLTGNPFYSLPLGSLPTNPRFVAWVENGAQGFEAVLRSADGWLTVARYLGEFAPLAALGWIVAAVFAGRQGAARLACAAIVAVVALWFVSVRYTNGGLFYSMRVLSPALALGSLAVGGLMARWGQRRAAQVAFGLLMFASVPASLALPQNPRRTAWREWPAFVEARMPVEPVVDLIRRDGARGLVMADSPGYQKRFAPFGVPVVPQWSPQVDWLFDAALTPEQAAQRCRVSGLHYIVLTKFPGTIEAFKRQARWMRAPFVWRTLGETDITLVLTIEIAQ